MLKIHTFTSRTSCCTYIYELALVECPTGIGTNTTDTSTNIGTDIGISIGPIVENAKYFKRKCFFQIVFLSIYNWGCFQEVDISIEWCLSVMAALRGRENCSKGKWQAEKSLAFRVFFSPLADFADSYSNYQLFPPYNGQSPFATIFHFNFVWWIFPKEAFANPQSGSTFSMERFTYSKRYISHIHLVNTQQTLGGWEFRQYESSLATAQRYVSPNKPPAPTAPQPPSHDESVWKIRFGLKFQKMEHESARNLVNPVAATTLDRREWCSQDKSSGHRWKYEQLY